MAEAIFIDCQK